jgi:hypothetical protein
VRANSHTAASSSVDQALPGGLARAYVILDVDSCARRPDIGLTVRIEGDIFRTVGRPVSAATVGPSLACLPASEARGACFSRVRSQAVCGVWCGEAHQGGRLPSPDPGEDRFRGECTVRRSSRDLAGVVCRLPFHRACSRIPVANLPCGRGRVRITPPPSGSLHRGRVFSGAILPGGDLSPPARCAPTGG